MIIKKERLSVLTFIGLLFFQISYLINNYVFYTNSYYGFETFQIPSGFTFFQGLVFLISTLAIPITICRPTDYFKFFYSFLVIFPNCFSTYIYNNFEFHNQLIYLWILALPLISVTLLEKLKFKLDVKIIKIEEDSLNWYLAFIALIFSLFIIIKFLDIGSFDLTNSYIRRMEGRKIFLPRDPVSYLLGLMFNVTCPFFSFLGGIKKEKGWIIFSLMIGILGFWSLGLKAPIFMSVLFLFVGYTFKTKYDLPKYILIIFNILCLIGILESNLTSFSFIGEFFVRRVFLVIPLMQSYFFETFMNLNLSEMVVGKDFKGFDDVTYFIGSTYLSNNESNANTTSILYFLVKKGIVGYLLNLLFLSGLFIFLNTEYAIKKSKIPLFIGLTFSVLIIEASFTAILFSSGLFLFIILSYYSYRSK